MGLKKGDARRGELLAASEKLFYTKGYENTIYYFGETSETV